jgi:hypothetical protein
MHHTHAQKLLDKTLEDGPGYAEIAISKNDLMHLRQIVLGSYQYRVASTHDSDLINRLYHCHLERYHESVNDNEHKILWPKISRMLDQEAIITFQDLAFYQDLRKTYGRFTITDEDNIGRENIYWRIVRPHKSSDIGPLHADYMFWELSGTLIPSHQKRVKVWIPIYCESGSSGLMLCPFSHKMNQEYTSEHRDGKLKPIFRDLDSHHARSLEIFHSPPGRALVFHDRLLHKGFHSGNKTRVSVEFTMLVNR